MYIHRPLGMLPLPGFQDHHQDYHFWSGDRRSQPFSRTVLFASDHFTPVGWVFIGDETSYPVNMGIIIMPWNLRIPIEPTRISSWNVTIVGERNHCSLMVQNPSWISCDLRTKRWIWEWSSSHRLGWRARTLWKMMAWKTIPSFLLRFHIVSVALAVQLPGNRVVSVLLRNVQVRSFDMESQDESFKKGNHAFWRLEFLVPHRWLLKKFW